MSDITAARVRVQIEDGVKKAEENAPAKKVLVEIYTDVAGDETFIVALDRIAVVAQDKVNELLGFPSMKQITAASVSVAAQNQAVIEGERRRGRPPKDKTKADLAAEAGIPANVDDILAGKAAEATAVVAQVATKPVDELDAILSGAQYAAPAEPTKDITDMDISLAVQKKNGLLKDAEKIRNLVPPFCPAGMVPSLRLIPQEKRQAFLDALAALS